MLKVRWSVSDPSAYKPPQQTLRARVLCGAGWLEGTFHVPRLHVFHEYLSHTPWYPLTDVRIEGIGPLPFFALARAETYFVCAANSHLEQPLSAVTHRTTQATFLIPGGVVDGTLEVAHEFRLSDFVEHTTTFLYVKKVSTRVWAHQGAYACEAALLNPRRLVGVTESGHP